MLAHELRETLVAVERVDAILGDRIVLRGIDLAIRNIVRPCVTQGQVVAVLGPSGAGKTTLLRIIAGLATPTRGRVLVGQQPVRAGMVGFVHQSYPLFEHRTVLGNLVVAARCGGASRAAAHERARAMLERFGLTDRLDAWPHELSGGQRQRVAILQQLLRGHTFLMMDEPFSGLDPICKAKTCDLIAEVAALDSRNTIIVATHDIRAAAAIADTMWLVGRDRDVPGARVVATYNLIERDLAWQRGIERTPQFAALVSELEDRFATL